MRTTIDLADDVAAAVERERRERGVGLSEAVNDLVRAGLMRDASLPPFRQETHGMGAGIDVSNVGETLEVLEGRPAP